jgi:hypothetical protein
VDVTRQYSTWPGDVVLKIRNLPQALHKPGVAVAVLQAAGYDAQVLVGDHYSDAVTTTCDRIAGIPDRTVLCAIVRAPAEDQQLVRIPRLLQWPGVPGITTITVQLSRVIPVGSHTAPSDHNHSTDTSCSAVQGIFWTPEQRPFPGSGLTSAAAAATSPQPQHDIIEMAAAMRAAEAAAADAAAAAPMAAARSTVARPRRRSQRPHFETIQRRLMRAFTKPSIADMLLAVTSSKGTTIPVQAKAMLGEAYVARQTQVQPQTGPKALACGSDPGSGLTRKGSGLAPGAQSRSGARLNTDWRSMPRVLPYVPSGQ